MAYKHNRVFGGFFIIIALFIASCANVVAPTGGPKDLTPPKLLSVTPADSSLNIKPKEIDLVFNKFMEIKDLDKNFEFSPTIKFTPTVMAYGKKVVIKIADTLLQPNTTYRLSFGRSLTDNRENTPYANYTYTFSTGAYFDSLQIKGQVFNAFTGFPDTSTVITLYNDTLKDSLLFSSKPLYTIRADRNGKFTMPYLPEKRFKLLAFADLNNDKALDPEKEKLAFMDSVIHPYAIGSEPNWLLYSFPQPALDSADSTPKHKQPINAAANLTGNIIRMPEYAINIDTLRQSVPTQDITKDLIITLSQKYKTLDTNKIRLSYDYNGVDVEAVINKFQIDSTAIHIKTIWQQDKLYTLRLMKGFANDTSGHTFTPGKFAFRSKSEDNYGKLTIHIPSKYYGEHFLLRVQLDTNIIYLKTVADSTVHLSMLQPGKYALSIIYDNNANGKQDNGNFLTHTQPEIAIPNHETIPLKEGWDNEVDFSPMDFTKVQKNANTPKQPSPNNPISIPPKR